MDTGKKTVKSIRFTEDEYLKIELELEKTGLNFSTFARSAILGYKIKLPITRDLLREMGRIGNNLNQIARRLNSGEALDVLPAMIAIEQQLKELKKC